MGEVVCENSHQFHWPGYNFFAILGIIVTSLISLRLLRAIWNLWRLYIWPNLRPAQDYVKLYGKWAVITGGSDGIGKGYALELAKRGMNICVLSNFENNIVSEIRSVYTVDVKWIDVDFSTTEVYERIEKEISQIDDIGILVNNVGMVQSKWQPLADQDRRFMEKIINVNMATVVMMTEIVLKSMLRQNRGLIVCMGSMASRVPTPYATLYASSKAFIENFSVCLASELSETKIVVKCIEPCFVRTQLLKDMTKFTDFLKSYWSWTFPDGLSFAATATSTFGVIGTPVVYAGYVAHEILTLIVPHSIGKETLANISTKFLRWLTSEV
ncbi:Hydroxysteroid dehydrogenase like 1 [Nesidiocoris tenuis]|nr:Hydroxysteroid dehydrogenase like 1 [Nesidiocoris tenuis]